MLSVSYIASLKGAISQEIIQRFYEFGYFQQDKIIESYICLAKNERDINQKNELCLMSKLKSLDNMRRQFHLSPQKIENMMDETHFAKDLERLRIFLESIRGKNSFFARKSF